MYRNPLALLKNRITIGLPQTGADKILFLDYGLNNRQVIAPELIRKPEYKNNCYDILLNSKLKKCK
jgi:hypothetical protein